MLKLFYQKTYMRTFLLLTGILIFALVPFVYFLSAEFSRYSMMEVRRNSQNEVNNLASKTATILGNLKSYGLSMYADQNIQNWFFATQSDPLIDHAVLLAQSNFMSTEPLIKRSYLINLRSGLVVDSKVGIAPFSSFADPDMLTHVAQFRRQYLHFFNHPADQPDSLALLLPATPERPSDFYLALLIDKALLSNLLFGGSIPAEQDIRILDEDGAVILGKPDPELTGQLYQAGLKQRGTSFQVRLPQQKWFVNTAKLGSDNWTVYYSNEYHTFTRHITAYRQKLITYTFVLLGIVSALFFWSSLFSLRSITFLSEKLRGKVALPANVSGVKPDIEWLDEGIETLLCNVEQLNQSMRNHSELVRSESLTQWVLHGKPGIRQLDYIQSHTKLASCSVLFLAVIRIDAYTVFCERYDYPSRKLIKYAIRNITEEIIARGPYVVEGLDLGGDHLILIVGSQEAAACPLHLLLQEAGEQVAQVLHVDTTVAVSNAYGFDTNIRTVYEHIYELTMLRFLSGERQVFRESDYEDFMAGYPAAAELLDPSEIIHTIRSGRVETALVLLRQQMKLIQELPYRDGKLYLTYFTYDLLKHFRKSRILEDIGSIHHLLDRYSTLAEFQDWLTDIVCRLASGFDVPKSVSRKEETVLEIKEYVDHHLQDAQLSIEQIADNFSLSAGYIRQLFKEYMNISLAEYLLQERVERVKERLVNSKLSVLEIADQCGFTSKGHFFAAFKKLTNLTPKQYRELHGDSGGGG